MVRGVPLVLLFFTIVLFGGLAAVLLDLGGNQLIHRNRQREKDVETIITHLESFARDNHSLPPMTSALRQIGTDSSGCALQTSSCSISNDACLSIHHLTKNRDLSLPSDLQIGTYYKTGYAVSYDDGSQYLKVVACGAEQDASISAQRFLGDLLMERRPSQNDKK